MVFLLLREATLVSKIDLFMIGALIQVEMEGFTGFSLADRVTIQIKDLHKILLNDQGLFFLCVWVLFLFELLPEKSFYI